MKQSLIVLEAIKVLTELY